MRTAIELAGFALVVAFFAVAWWPSALLAAGVLLIAHANLPRATAPAPAGDGA